MSAEIKKIVLKIDKKEIELTPEQAKKLHGLLDEMYCKKEVIYPSYPMIWRERNPYWIYGCNTWCADGGETISYSASSGTAEIGL